MKRRRAFLIALLASSLAPAWAQTAKPVRVAILWLGSPTGAPRLPRIFVAAMRELGWVEGRNVVFDFASAENDAARLPQLAKDLVGRRPDVIVVPNNATAQAAFAATRTIPIVFTSVSDPVDAGLVKTLAKPGGNATGVSPFRAELGARRMQLLKEILPSIRRVGVLVADAPGLAQERKQIEHAAGSQTTVVSADVKSPEDLRAALATLADAKVEAILLTQHAMFLNARKVIIEFAVNQRVPVVGHYSQLAEQGALMSYASNLGDHHRRAAHIVDKVLRGTKPGDIPVEQPTKFELVLNVKTAKALGIRIPESVLLQADRVIE